MHRALARLDHRPWPVPSGPWVLRQRWRNLLFAHWPVAAARLRHLVPAGLAIEEFGGTSWVGIVPFRIEGLTWRFLPSLPYLSSFPEINLRLYVERGGRPGVWPLQLAEADIRENTLASAQGISVDERHGKRPTPVPLRPLSPVPCPLKASAFLCVSCAS